MVFLLFFQTSANSIALTSTFLAAAGFLATNAGVIIPACAVVVVMAGAAIAVWDVVDRIFGKNTNTTTGTTVIQALANGALGLSRGIGGVTSLATAGRSQILSGTFDSASALSSLEGISRQAETVRSAMDSQIASTRAQMVYSDACNDGLANLQDLSEPRVSSISAVTAVVQRGVATAASSLYQAILEGRRKWVDSTSDLREAIGKLKRDTQQGVGVASHTIRKRIDAILEDMGKTGESIRDSLDRVRRRILGIGTSISESIQNLRQRIVYSREEIEAMKQQYAKISNVSRISGRSGDSAALNLQIPTETVDTGVARTAGSENLPDQEYYDLYTQYRDSYREYFRLARENPDSDETRAAYKRYRDLYRTVTGSEGSAGGAANTAIAPGIQSAMEQ